MISSGRRPSWSFASSQVFVPSTTVVAGVYVLVITKPLTEVSYPSTFSSVTVYSISFPFEYLSRSENGYLQPFSAVTVTVSITSPFARRLIVMLSGRMPSWSLASFQSLIISMLFFSGA